MGIQTTEPSAIRAGDSVTWQRELPEFSAADGWALKYRLLYASGAAVAITSTGVGTLHTVDLKSTDTAAYVAGDATLVGYVENTSTGDRATLESNPIKILPDLTQAANFDGRSANMISLANLRTALASMVADSTITVLSTSVDGRSTTFRSMQELKDAITHYEREVQKENVAQALLNGVSPGRVVVRF
jgi:hypothetical protein